MQISDRGLEISPTIKEKFKKIKNLIFPLELNVKCCKNATSCFHLLQNDNHS